jgi:hypothetical protein
MALPKYFEAIENHLDNFIEKDNDITVFDEIESPDFHLDVYWIKPNKDRNYILLMTNGISSIPLKTPKKDFSKYIELCILLPKGWKLENEDWRKDKNYWPIKILKDIGRYPSRNDTWLGYGHSIPTGIPIIGTKFTGILLIKSKILPEEFQQIKYGRNKIELYTLLPLYGEELEYKKNNGTKKLLELFEEKNINEIINIKRKNVCKDIK